MGLPIPAYALTQEYSEVIRIDGNVTCPDLYPVKTGSSSGGVYTTTCFSTLAWSKYMAGGDEWQEWIDGTYVPTPTPTPTVTVTAEPIVTERWRTNTVIQEVKVLEPCPVLTKPKEIRAEIKKLKRQLKVQIKQRKIQREIQKLKRKINALNANK
jgi:hypothetical protein